MWTRGAGGAGRRRACDGRRGGWRQQKRAKTSDSNTTASPAPAPRAGIAKKLLWIAGGAAVTYAGAHALVTWGEELGAPSSVRDVARRSLFHVDTWTQNMATSVQDMIVPPSPQRVSGVQEAPAPVRLPKEAAPHIVLSASSTEALTPSIDSISATESSVSASPALETQQVSMEAADVVAYVRDATRMEQVTPDTPDEEPAASPVPSVVDEPLLPLASPDVGSESSVSISEDSMSSAAELNPPSPQDTPVEVPTLEQHLELKELIASLQLKYTELKDMLGEQTQMEAARIREIIRQYESNFQRYLSDQELQHSNVQREQARLFESHLQELRVEVASALSSVSQSARSRHNERLESIHSTLSELTTLQESFQKLIARSKDESHLLNIARVSLLLQRHLADHPSLPFDSLLKELQLSSRDIPSLSELARSIPADVAAQGLPSLDALRAEFERTASQARRATLTSPSSSLLDNLIAIFREKVTPEHQKVGLVSGNDNWAKLARANWFIRNGQLEAAVSEVDSMDGQPRDLMMPFVAKARDAVSVSQRLRLLSIATANALRQ